MCVCVCVCVCCDVDKLALFLRRDHQTRFSLGEDLRLILGERQVGSFLRRDQLFTLRFSLGENLRLSLV